MKTTHRARWSIADIGERRRTYKCMLCDATRTVEFGQMPELEEHGDFGPLPKPWSLPHMENAPGPAGRDELLAELERAEAELGNAIFMHRAAWVKARERRDELDLSALGEGPRNRAAVVAALCETDPKYSRRIADVKFWLGERTGLAATVTALVGMLQLRPRRQIPHQR